VNRAEFQGELTVSFVTGNNCSIPTNAQAYVVNATVVPSGSLGFLTLWPDGIPQPLVSTLNAEDGSVTSNMAIVSTTNGSIDTFASSDTQLILDVSGYFASPPAATPAPVVWIAGDSLVAAWGNPQIQQANPTWAFYPPPIDPTSGEVDAAAETSGALLTRMQTLLAATSPASYPEYLIILVGTFDMLAPDWVAPCGSFNGESPAPAANTCANLTAIYTLAHTKGIKVLLCSVPYTTNAGAAGTALINQYPWLVPDEQLMDLNLLDDDEDGLPNMADGFVDIEDAIDPGSIDGGGDGAPAIDWTDDGLNPNTTGALVFTSTAQAVMTDIKGATFRRRP
jgi:hypothetical protein